MARPGVGPSGISHRMSTHDPPPLASPLRRDASGCCDAPGFGVLSALERDHVYWLGERGLVYTSPWVVTRNTERPSAVLLLSARDRPVALHVAGHVLRGSALAIAPLTRRDLRAVDASLVSINVQPHHPLFGPFVRIPPPGVMALPRSAFRPLDVALRCAYEGRLTLRDASRLFEAAVEIAAARLARPDPVERKADELIRLVQEHPGASLRDLARWLRISYTEASRLFSRRVGLPFRVYRQWCKTLRANERLGGARTLTELAQDAGFADLSHLSRTWHRDYGLSPSYLRDRRHVQIVG